MSMTPEEKERYDRIDRQIEFLAAHQARLSSDIAALNQATSRLAETSARHDEQFVQQGSHIQSLADSVLRLARVVDERDRQTSEKLNTLITVVERYFSNGKRE